MLGDCVDIISSSDSQTLRIQITQAVWIISALNPLRIISLLSRTRHLPLTMLGRHFDIYAFKRLVKHWRFSKSYAFNRTVSRRLDSSLFFLLVLVRNHLHENLGIIVEEANHLGPFVYIDSRHRGIHCHHGCVCRVNINHPILFINGKFACWWSRWFFHIVWSWVYPFRLVDYAG